MLLISCMTLLPVSFSQSLQASYSLAQNQLEIGNYAEAQKLFERVIYFAPEKAPVLAPAYQNLAKCHRINGNFVAAADAYELAYRLTSNPTTQTELIFRKSECMILSGLFLEAKRDLFYLDQAALSIDEQVRLNRLLGFADLGLDKLESARKHFDATYRLRGVVVPDSLDRLWRRLNKNWEAKTRWAKISSLVIPGSGLMALGDFKSGTNSLLLNGGIYAIGIFIARDFTFVEAAITVVPWLQRYYMGGLQNIEAAVYRKRQGLKNRLMRAWVVV